MFAALADPVTGEKLWLFFLSPPPPYSFVRPSTLFPAIAAAAILCDPVRAGLFVASPRSDAYTIKRKL